MNVLILSEKVSSSEGHASYPTCCVFPKCDISHMLISHTFHMTASPQILVLLTSLVTDYFYHLDITSSLFSMHSMHSSFDTDMLPVRKKER